MSEIDQLENDAICLENETRTLMDEQNRLMTELRTHYERMISELRKKNDTLREENSKIQAKIDEVQAKLDKSPEPATVIGVGISENAEQVEVPAVTATAESGTTSETIDKEEHKKFRFF